MNTHPHLTTLRALARSLALSILFWAGSHAAPPNGSFRIAYQGVGQPLYSSVPDIPRYEVVALRENFVPRGITDNLTIVGMENYSQLVLHHGGTDRILAQERGRPAWVDINEAGAVATIYGYGDGTQPHVCIFWLGPEAPAKVYDWKVNALPKIIRFGRAAWNDVGDFLYELRSAEGSDIYPPQRVNGQTRLYNVYSGEDTLLTEHVTILTKERTASWIGLQMIPVDINNYGDHVADFLDEEAYFDRITYPKLVIHEDRYFALNYDDRLEFSPDALNDRGTVVGKRSYDAPDLLIRDEFGTRMLASDLPHLRDNRARMSNPADGLEEIIIGEDYWKRNIETDAQGNPTGRPAPDFWSGPVEQLADFPYNWFNITATCISANGAIAGTANFYYTGESRHRLIGWYLAPVGLLTDWNRDGRIDYRDRKLASSDQKWRFWTNDDDDDGADARSSRDDLPAATNPDHANDHVDGLRDLVDFFPLWLDLKRYLVNKDLHKVRIRLSHRDSALRFVYTSLTPQSLHLKRSSLIGSGCGPSFSQPLANATSLPVPASGVELSQDFIRKVAANGGILLLEATAPTNQPLVMEFYYEDKRIFSNTFKLSISTVREMMRILNLRNADEKFTGAGAGPWSTDMADPSNLPDFWLQATSGTSSVPTLVHLHGFNWGAEDIPAAHSEIFKRFFQSGSPARFVGVSWFSDQGAIDLFNTAFDYNENVINALVTAPLLRAGLAGFEDTPIALFSHSLGSLVAASTVAEHGLPAAHLFLVNSAIPAESINGRPTHWRRMVHPLWKGSGSASGDYAPFLHAANWADLFSSGDFRSTLRWTDRLAALPEHCLVTNFYSSAEDVLRPGNGDLPNLISDIWEREEIWVYNEMVKGTNSLAATLTGDRQGGWGFNRHYMQWDDPGGPAHPPSGEWKPLPVAEANRIQPAATIREPFFLPFSGGDPDFPQWGNGEWLHEDAATANAHLPDPADPAPSPGLLKNRSKIIAEAIPALSDATGATPLPDIPLFQNINLDAAYRNPAQWPERADVRKRQRWLHSDYLNPALPFVHRLYESCVQTLLDL